LTPPTRRARVLRVIARLNVGGPALHATLLTERLDRSRYESLLVTGRESAAEGNYLTLYGKTDDAVVLIPTLGREIRGGQDLVALTRLVGLMRTFRPDIVHTHTAKAGTLGRLAARWCRVPVVVHTYHGHVLQGYFSPPKARLFLAIERWLGRRTDALLAVSDRVRHELLELGIGRPDRFVVLPLGLDLDGLLGAEARRGELRRELGFAADDFLVGIVARLVPIKAHEVFFRAAAILAGRLPRARFVVVGDGERRGELEASARALGLGERVRFVGWRRDLERVYADLDVVVLTSRNEGSPVSLIEAMAAARPVVATRVGGVPDLVEHGVNGVLVEVDDAAAIARAVETLAADPQRGLVMGRAGRKRVYPAFSASRLIDDVDRLYQDLLGADAC
jgi:glycosyltransferase involved in cell wall biosynthesis